MLCLAIPGLLGVKIGNALVNFVVASLVFRKLPVVLLLIDRCRSVHRDEPFHQAAKYLLFGLKLHSSKWVTS